MNEYEEDKDDRQIGLLTEEGDCLPTVEETMVVCECYDHDRADDDLSVDYDGFFLDRVHTWKTGRHPSAFQQSQDTRQQRTKDSGLWKVNNGSSV